MHVCSTAFILSVPMQSNSHDFVGIAFIILSRSDSFIGENLLSCGSVVYGVVLLNFSGMFSIFWRKTLQNLLLVLALSVFPGVGLCYLVQ